MNKNNLFLLLFMIIAVQVSDAVGMYRATTPLGRFFLGRKSIATKLPPVDMIQMQAPLVPMNVEQFQEQQEQEDGYDSLDDYDDEQVFMQIAEILEAFLEEESKPFDFDKDIIATKEIADVFRRNLQHVYDFVCADLMVVKNKKKLRELEKKKKEIEFIFIEFEQFDIYFDHIVSRQHNQKDQVAIAQSLKDRLCSLIDRIEKFC